MSLFTQIIILIVVLSCMVMVLLAIRQLSNFEGFDDTEETRQLKEDVEDDDKIISESNIFRNLVDTKPEEIVVKERFYKSNSKDPLSRRE